MLLGAFGVTFQREVFMLPRQIIDVYDQTQDFLSICVHLSWHILNVTTQTSNIIVSIGHRRGKPLVL